MVILPFLIGILSFSGNKDMEDKSMRLSSVSVCGYDLLFLKKGIAVEPVDGSMHDRSSFADHRICSDIA